MKRKSEETYIAEIATVTNPKNDSTRFFLWIKKIDIKMNNINLIQIISHEMDHLGFEVLDYRGIPAGVRNQEAKCYFSDEVLAKVLRKLKVLKKIKL